MPQNPFLLKQLEILGELPVESLILGKFPFADVRRYGSLNAAVAAIGPTQLKTLVVSTQTYLTDDLTIPANIHTQVFRGGRIYLGNYDFASEGPFIAGRFRVFYETGAGIVTHLAVDKVLPEWFGAKADDGVTDNGTAFNRAMNPLTSGIPLDCATGIYGFDTTFIANKEGIRITGRTPRASHIHDSEKATVFRLTSDVDLLRLTMPACSVENIYFDGNGYAKKLTEILDGVNDLTFDNVTWLDGMPAIHATRSVHNSFDNCLWKNCGNGAITPAMKIINGETGGQNCSDWWFTKCCWEPSAGDQIEFDSGGAGSDNNQFYFFAPKCEGTYKFIKGTAGIVQIFGGYLRVNGGPDTINLTGSQVKAFGTSLQGTTRAVYILGDRNVFDGCETYCPDVAAGPNIELVGAKNRAIGCWAIGYGSPVALTGGYNTDLSTREVIFQDAAPVAGAWRRGAICFNTAPSAAGKVGWVCTSGGTPGTWKPFGVIDA